LIEAAGNLIGPLITAAGPVITTDEVDGFVKLLQGKLVCWRMEKIQMYWKFFFLEI